jgi:hypothetical protein
LIGEHLFSLTARDTQSQRLITVHETVINQQANILVGATFTVPLGRVLVLHRVVLEAVPNAIVQVNALFATLAQEEPSPFRFPFLNTLTNGTSGGGGIGIVALDSTHLAPTGMRVVTVYDGEMYLSQGHRIIATAGFNNGAVVNSLEMAVHGVLIPYGNFSV